MKPIFKTLNEINVNKHTEKKQNLTYLSWAWAWAEVKKSYPQSTYQIQMFNGKPYIYDEDLGYMVFTTLCIECETLEMWLPVMDGANKAMLNKDYTYQVKDWTETNKQGKTIMKEKVCSKATMFDINKTIMRCLVKNIAMFGLGLYLYAGEDLPEEIEPKKKPSLIVESDEFKSGLSKGSSIEAMEKYFTITDKTKKEYNKQLNIRLNCDATEIDLY